MTECCKNCKYRHQLKELVNKEWQYRDICTVQIETEPNPTYDSWAICVGENVMCEMFTEVENETI